MFYFQLLDIFYLDILVKAEQSEREIERETTYKCLIKRVANYILLEWCRRVKDFCKQWRTRMFAIHLVNE